MVVVTNIWLSTWTVIALSLSLLASIVILILCCVCWEDKKGSRNELCLVENPKKPSIINNNLSGKVLQDNNAHPMLRNNSVVGEHFKKAKNSYSLLAPKHKKLARMEGHIQVELSPDAFDNVDMKSCYSNGRDFDTFSCISSDSKNSFYSVYPHARKHSMADTMRSAISQPNLQDFIE